MAETPPSAGKADLPPPNELARRTAMLQAVGYAASSIIASDDWQKGVDELLRRLGEATAVSRVTLWEVHAGPGGRRSQSCRHDWAAPGFLPIARDPRYHDMVIEDEVGNLEDWSRLRQRGEVIQATLDEVTGETRQTFLEHQTKSFVSVPILLRDRWWGFLGFDDCVETRRWSDLEIDILKTATAMLAAAIERQESDERLRLSEERYALAARGAADGLFDIDLQKNRAYFSPRLYEILDALEGSFGSSIDRFSDAFQADDAKAARDYFQERLRHRRRRFRFEVRRWQGGAIRWFVARGLILYSRKGPLRAVGSLRDITDYRRAVDELKRSEARSRAILNAASDAIITTDEVGLVVAINPAAERLFGFTAAAALGQPVGDLIVPKRYRAAHQAGMKRYLQGGEPHVLGKLIELEARRSNGPDFPVELTVTEVPLPEGRLFTAIIRDISERKRYQQQLADGERQRGALARHFSPNMVEELMRLGGRLDDVRTQPIAVLFADLMNFTALSSSLPPEEVVATLREFHGVVEEAVFGNEGTLDKYMGDGLMATFGTPLAGERDATHALSCARQLVRGVGAWNRRRAEAGKGGMMIGIGLHYGRATLGNVGSDRRHEHTVVGETVNLASRIENLTRTLQSAILMSEAVVDAVRREGGGELLRGAVDKGLHEIRGHATPMRLWGVTSTVLDYEGG